MQTILEEIPITDHGLIRLGHTSREVEPYKGFEQPTQLRTPLGDKPLGQFFTCIKTGLMM